MAASGVTSTDESQGKLSLMLAIGAVAGYRAGGTSPKSGPAFVGFVIGTILFLIFMGFMIAEA